MKYDVETGYGGIPHYRAYCNQCDWIYENYHDRRAGQRQIRRHVSQTGHEVTLEKCVVTFYSPILSNTGMKTDAASLRAVEAPGTNRGAAYA